jgi:LPS-assembly protein
MKYFLLFILLLAACCLLPAIVCADTITADHLEYFKEEEKYIATGNVWIEKEGEDVVLTADKVIMYQKTSDVEAIGNVIYEDKDTLINTEHAEINMDTKKGKLYNAVILFKKDNYRISGKDVVKLKEDHYYAKTATFTTCDSEPSKNPDWCFKGSNVDIVVGKKMTTQNATFRVKGLPVLYSPFFWAPVKTKRETGFLFPAIGNSNEKGFQFSPSFFWAIDDNKDATFYLDYFSKRGIGTGAEYRYLDLDSKGSWYAYHIKDKEVKRDFWDIKGFNEYDIEDVRAYADINYVSHIEFYREYGYRSKELYKRDMSIPRFLQSSGEISKPLGSDRAYFLAQYWRDLQGGVEKHVPQKLPEVGYSVSPKNVGPLMFTMSPSIANFHRTKEPGGQRLDINPKLSYSFGNAVPLFQSLAVRATAYNLSNGGIYGSSPHRETFEYRANVLTRLSKRYESFTHNIEPSISYTFIPQTHNLPTFDSTELFNKTSVASFSLYNGLNFERLSISTSLSQPIDFNAGDRPLSPTSLSIGISGSYPLSLSFSMSHNFNRGRTESMTSTLGWKPADKTTVNISQTYTDADERYFYNIGVDSVLSKKFSAKTSISYDARAGLRDSSLSINYSEQCWTLFTTLARRPGDNLRPPEYSFIVMVQLKGVWEPFKLYRYQTDTTVKQ